MFRIVKILITALFIIQLIIACRTESKQELQLRQTVNKELRMDIFPSVISEQNIQAFKDFRDKYKYISVVFLRKGCKPCDVKIAEWQKRKEKISELEDYSILFIFQGFNYDEILELDTTHSLNFICDLHCRYLTYNEDIPEWILDQSVLIDATNRIKLIGDPFSNREKTEKLYSIVRRN